MRFIEINGVRYLWKDIRQLRREQIAASRKKREPRDKRKRHEKMNCGRAQARSGDAH